MPKLYELTIAHQQLATLEESDDLPAEVLRDTLEAIEGDIEVKSVTIAKMVKNLQADADAIREAAKAMMLRADRVDNRADRIKNYMLFTLGSAGIKRIECPFFVIKIVPNPKAVEIVDPTAIPAEYMRQPEPPPPAPDKKKIKAALERGDDVPGAWLVQGERIEIKT